MKSIEPRASRGFSLFLDLQKRFRRVYHPHIKSREYWTGVLLGFIFLSGALILNYYS